MSIDQSILNVESDGKLVRYIPQRTLHSAKRRLFMTATAHQQLASARSAINLLNLRGGIDAALTLWTVGDRVLNDGKRKPKGGFIKRLEAPPPEIWEIRIAYPMPAIRAFGRFAEPDTLILTDFQTRATLGKKGSPAWAAAGRKCETDWISLFGNAAPHTGVRVSDYITENCDDFQLA